MSAYLRYGRSLLQTQISENSILPPPTPCSYNRKTNNEINDVI